MLGIQSGGFGGGMGTSGISDTFGGLTSSGQNAGQNAGGTGIGGTGQNDTLEQVIGLLVKALVKMLEGGQGQSAQGAGGGQAQGGGQSSELGDMLQKMMDKMQQNGGADQGGLSGNSKDAQGGDGKMGMEDMMKMMLMMLMMTMMKGGASNGGDPSASGDSGAGGIGGAGGAGGASGGMGGPGGLGQNGGAGGLSMQDLGKSLVDLGNTLMQGAGETSLGNAIQPAGDGGGQVGNGLAKDLLKLVGQMMDNNPGIFGQSGGQSGGPSIDLSISMS